jgi:ATP-dependent Clp protease adaptor protein ClpS
MQTMHGIQRRANPAATTHPHVAPRESTRTLPAVEPQWQVVVLNDDVNLMTYVVHVFRQVFGYEKERARKHMLEVHEQGRSVLWSGSREPAEHYLHTLHQWHLTAKLEIHV